MKFVKLDCPKCGARFYFANWFMWVLHSPFHMFAKRLTKCPHCGERNFMKRTKG